MPNSGSNQPNNHRYHVFLQLASSQHWQPPSRPFAEGSSSCWVPVFRSGSTPLYLDLQATAMHSPESLPILIHIQDQEGSGPNMILLPFPQSPFAIAVSLVTAQNPIHLTAAQNSTESFYPLSNPRRPRSFPSVLWIKDSKLNTSSQVDPKVATLNLTLYAQPTFESNPYIPNVDLLSITEWRPLC